MVEKILWLLAVGVDGSVMEEVFGVREITIRSWLCRNGVQGRNQHERLILELEGYEQHILRSISNVVLMLVGSNLRSV